MSDTPLFRNGKAVLKTRVLPGGSILMFKPFIIKDEHVMRLTGAPGWDKQHVDDVFAEGVTGKLRYIKDAVQYDISIEDFRVHAFAKDSEVFGSQYHVHQKYYTSTGVINPKRESFVEKEIPLELPQKITFGEWLICSKCKGSGGTAKERCSKCQGQGLVKWTGSSATSSS